MRDLVLILGGSSGLGSSIADLLSYKFEVCNVARRESKSATYNISCDFSSESSVANALGQITEKFNHRKFAQFYWVTGVLDRAEIADANITQLTKMIDVNFRNPLPLVQFAWRQLSLQSSEGKFCVISSTAGLSEKPRADEAVYAATKSAQVAFTRAIGKNNDLPQLKVSLFCPGGMQTDFWNSNPHPDFSSFLDPKKVANFIVETVFSQTEPYLEKVIPRGSL